MTQELLKKVISTTDTQPDDLVVGVSPEPRIGSATLKQGTGTLKRGTLLAKSSSDAKLVVLGTTPESGETLEPYGILTDDVDISKDDVPATVYIGGMFNANKIIVKTGYTITESDKDTLRKYNIEFKAAFTY